MLARRHKLTSRGDTIVEVMVVLAVLGMAIGISYATANRSLENTRQAQENSQATEYVQSQVEALRYLAPSSSTNPSDNVRQLSAYCIHDPTSATPITLAASPTGCSFGSLPYTVVIYSCDDITTAPCDSPNITSGSDTFVVQATWPDVLGQGTDTVTMAYRVHPQ